MINNLILWEKYRPKNLKTMVLLPRIESYVNDGIKTNMIFYGTSGTGKTTLAKIIASEFNSLTLNGKLGIELLSQNIKNHFESLNLMNKNKTKLIFIDEFDRATIQLQDGLKSFIEEYPDARFIFTTNHIEKITPELKSRFSCIPFDPINAEEREYLLDKQCKYIRAIAKKEGYEDFNNIELFNKIILKNFPDLRSSIVSTQHIITTNDKTNLSDYGSDKMSLFNFLMNKNLDPVINYDYVMNNFFVNFDDAFKYLSRPLFEYLKDYHVDMIMVKGAAILKTQKEYNETLDITLDPLVHLVNYIIDLKTIIAK